MTECIVNYNALAEVTRFIDKEALFNQIAEELRLKLNQCSNLNQQLTLAISGGSTPVPLFELLAKEYIDMKWGPLQLFWVDERMVPGDHPESNYGSAKKAMLDLVPLPSSNIHFINGDNTPETETEVYASHINKIVPRINNLPAFDLIWLGIGADGHTASLFPDTVLMSSNGITGISEHPVTRQKRITLTEEVINNAAEVIFIVTGSEKETVAGEIFRKEDLTLPAARIKPVQGRLKWYLDF